MTGVVNGTLQWPVYLPAGTWVSWNGTQTFAGPATTAETYGLGDIPLFVRGGGLLALKTMASVAAHADPVVWAAWPGAAAGGFTLYEDEGDSDAYQGGEYMTTTATYAATAAAFRLTVAAANVSGALVPGALSARGHVLQLRGVGARAVASVTVNGAPVPPAAPGVVPGYAVVGEADHTLAAPAGALVVSAGASFDVFSPTVVVVNFA